MVLAADSRGTFGDPRGITAQNDAQQKAHILSSHVGALVAGSGAVGSLVLDAVKQQIKDARTDGATPVMNALREHSRTSYNNWFPTVAAIPPAALAATGQVAVRPDLAFIVAGYETDNVTPRLYGLMSAFDFSPMLHDYGFAVTGVAQYALYLLNRLYQSERAVKELVSLATYVITETASQDGKVGGPVSVITIKPGAEGCKTMSPEEVQEIEEANKNRSLSLRNSFYNNKKEEPSGNDPKPI